jgi:hypothetical protein
MKYPMQTIEGEGVRYRFWSVWDVALRLDLTTEKKIL